MMNRRRAKLRSLLPLLLLLPFTVGFSNTEFACEEAYAHVQDCCGNDAPRLSCESSCNASPDLAYAEADCLRRSSCDELRAAGVCTSWDARVCQ